MSEASENSSSEPLHIFHVHVQVKNIRRLYAAAIVTGAFMVVEFVVGYLVLNSYSLLADSLHMLIDASGLGMLIAAKKIKFNDPLRSEAAIAMVSNLLLWGGLLWGWTESIVQITNPEPNGGWPIILVGTLGLSANIFVLKLLGSPPHDSEHSHSHHAAHQHVWLDILGSLAAIASGTLILLVGLKSGSRWVYVIDPILGILVTALVLREAWQLLVKSARVLYHPRWGYSVAQFFRSHEVKGCIFVGALAGWILLALSLQDKSFWEVGMGAIGFAVYLGAFFAFEEKYPPLTDQEIRGILAALEKTERQNLPAPASVMGNEESVNAHEQSQ